MDDLFFCANYKIKRMIVVRLVINTRETFKRLLEEEEEEVKGSYILLLRPDVFFFFFFFFFFFSVLSLSQLRVEVLQGGRDFGILKEEATLICSKQNPN
jgi:hypothetical protein